MFYSTFQRCAKRNIVVEHENPISRYYERLATVQARGSQASHQVLRDILKEVQTNIVPRGFLKEWAMHTFPNATDYGTFRKTVSSAFITKPRYQNALSIELVKVQLFQGRSGGW